MRQTVKEIEVNVAYRWFLGLEMMDKVPHFSTFGKNYTRRFKDTGLFEQIFSHILQECYKFKLIDPSEVFVDSTHVKARANNKKMQKRIAQEEALFFEDLLKKEINEDREAHGKRPLKEKDDDSNPAHPVAKKKRRLKQVLLTLKVDGSTKGNIKVYLPMQYRPRVIRMAEYLVIVFIRETIMTAEPLSSCMTR